jgi:dTDP-4-dehydrorhamnose 3,5-epimerase
MGRVDYNRAVSRGILSVPEALQAGVALPGGVRLEVLVPHRDGRGTLTEMFREEGGWGPRPRQWNVVHSGANVLRGVHVHRVHTDYLTMAAGSMVLGLHDLRSGMATRGLSVMLELRASEPAMVVIPPGVAHGFYFEEPACYVIGVTEYFHTRDELGCSWDAEEFRFAWPCDHPILSERDASAPSYAAMVATLGL